MKILCSTADFPVEESRHWLAAVQHELLMFPYYTGWALILLNLAIQLLPLQYFPGGLGHLARVWVM